MANLDARDALTVLLTVARHKTGIRIEERRFVGASLASQIAYVRADLISLADHLRDVQEQAWRER